MTRLRPELEYLLDKAQARDPLSRCDAAWLIRAVDPLSRENEALMGAADKVARDSSDGTAAIHGQIGVNVAPCRNNCDFCSFSARSGLFRDRIELSLEEVIARANRFVAEGVDAIYLMTAGRYDFNRYLSIAEAVRVAIPAEVLLVANTEDLTPREARQLVRAGFQGAYHAVRMGEGRDTGIPPERRLATMRAIVGAGLKLAYCVEPIGPEHMVEEIVEKIFIGKELGAWFSGAMRRTPVTGTPLAGRGAISELELAKIVAVVRLVMGDAVPLNCTHEPNLPSLLAGANLIWAESGANPRDLKEDTEAGRGLTAVRCGQLLRSAGYRSR